MKHEAKKIARIVDEVLTYFLYHFNALCEMTVIPEANRYVMRFHFFDIEISDADFAKLSEKLHVRRQPELEDYYWELTGAVEDSNELMLVAMMCDSIAINRQDRDITIELGRLV